MTAIQYAFSLFRSQMEKCRDKYGIDVDSDRPTSKFVILYNTIQDYESANVLDLPENESSNLIFNLGIATEICGHYLKTKELKKEDMMYLNKIYRKYK